MGSITSGGMTPAERFIYAYAARTGRHQDDLTVAQALADSDLRLFDADPRRQLQNGWSVCSPLALALEGPSQRYTTDSADPDDVRNVWEALRFARVRLRKPDFRPSR